MIKLIWGFALTVFSLNLSAQETVVDSVENKIEKYYNTGISDSVRADYKAKIEHLNKYIAQDSLRADAFLQRGAYYAFLGLHVQAIEDYNSAIALDAEQPIAYFNRGLAKARFRYTYDACYDLKKANLLGVDQAAKVLESNCRLYLKEIENSLVSN